MTRTSNSESGYFEITAQVLKDNCIIRCGEGSGPKRIRDVGVADTTTYECLLCKLKRIQPAMLEAHIENPKHYEIVMRRGFGTDEFTDERKYHANCVQYSLEYLLRDGSMDEEEFAARSNIVSELEERLQTAGQIVGELKDVTVDMYGSSVFNAALKGSDINCFLRVKEYLLAVGKVKEVLEQFAEYTDVQLLPSHRYPRIKITHTDTTNDTEKERIILMCFYSQKSENFSELMNVYGMCDERFLQLARLLKIHCKELNLVDGVVLSNHLFYIMTVSFCQRTQPPILPTFECTYDNLMTKSEEEIQRKQPSIAAAALVNTGCTDMNMRMFAGNVVLGALRQSMFNLAIENDMNISCEEIDECLKKHEVCEKLFPKVTPENDPWNQGVAGPNQPMPSVDAWNTDISPPPPTQDSSPESTTQPSSSAKGGWENVTVFEDKAAKYTLTEWGNKFLSGVRQVCNQWEVKNKDQLHKLFQQMLRFYSKFSYDRHMVSIRSSCKQEPLPERSHFFVEDPFQPNATLFNPNFNSKSRRNRKTRNKLCTDLVKHIKDVFCLMRQYYEGVHRKKLCLAGGCDPESSYKQVPPYSFFEMAIRYKIPRPLTDICGETHIPKQEKLPPLGQIPDASFQAVEKIIVKILDKYSMSEQDIEEREKTFSELTELVKTKVSDVAKPTWFGSSRNGLVLCTSDMDITLDIGKNVIDPSHLLNGVGTALKQSENFIFSDIILQCRVPIVKFKRTDNNLTGDIAVGNMLAIRNTFMIKIYTEIDVRVRELGYLIKVLVKECECADASTGSLSSYAYTMMVLYFLQQVEPPVIPVLQEIKRPNDVKEYLVEERDTYFYDNVDRLPSFWITENTDSSAKLAIQFFKFYYEEFDYSKHVIAPKQKERLLCTDKGWFKSVNIEDPFNLDHNLGKQVTPKIFEVIKTVFKQAYLRFSVEPTRSEVTMEHYLDKNYLLDGKAPPINFICYGCGSRDHYVHECPNKNSSRCTECNESGHTKSECPKIKCFTCHGIGHIGVNCPKKRDKKHMNSPMKYPRTPHKQYNKDKDKPSKAELEVFDRKNWLGNTLNVGTVINHNNKKRNSNSFNSNSFNDHKEEQKRTGTRTMSETHVLAEQPPAATEPRRPKENSKKKKKRNSNSESNKDSILNKDFIPIKPWSDPYSNEPYGSSSGYTDKMNKKSKPTNNVLHVKTSGESGGKLVIEKPKTDPVKSVKPATHMKLMGAAVQIDVPDQAKETSRQKKSKSMVRKDLFGDTKPRNAGGNKKQTVKTGKPQAPVPHGSGRVPTKTEVYVPRGDEDPEMCRYGPKRDTEDYSADLAPDFFTADTHKRFVNDPDPNDLSQWGDLTPSMEADPVLGATLHSELNMDSYQQQHQPYQAPNNWIDYLSSSPEKPVAKPTSTFFNAPQQQAPPQQQHPSQPPPSQQQHPSQQPPAQPQQHHGSFSSPPKNVASVQLLNQLHRGGEAPSSPSKQQQPADMKSNRGRKKKNSYNNNNNSHQQHQSPNPSTQHNNGYPGSPQDHSKYYRTKPRSDTFPGGGPPGSSPRNHHHFHPQPGSSPRNHQHPPSSVPNSFMDPKNDPYLQRPPGNHHPPGYTGYNGPGGGNGPNFDALKRRPNTGRGRAANPQWTGDQYNRRR